MKNSESIGNDADSIALAEIKRLFTEVCECKESNNMGAARKSERRVARLVAQITARSPNTSIHAEALHMHHLVLLWLAAISKRKDISLTLRNAGYDAEAASLRIDIKIQGAKPALKTIFNANNLGIDLIHTEKRPREGLQWMLEAQSLLEKFAGKKKLPAQLRMFKLFSLDYNIAKAKYELGDADAARTLLVHALSLAPRLHQASRSYLSAIADSAQLLSEILINAPRGE